MTYNRLPLSNLLQTGWQLIQAAQYVASRYIWALCAIVPVQQIPTDAERACCEVIVDVVVPNMSHIGGRLPAVLQGQVENACVRFGYLGSFGGQQEAEMG